MVKIEEGASLLSVFQGGKFVELRVMTICFGDNTEEFFWKRSGLLS